MNKLRKLKHIHEFNGFFLRGFIGYFFDPIAKQNYLLSSILAIHLRD